MHKKKINLNNDFIYLLKYHLIHKIISNLQLLTNFFNYSKKYFSKILIK